MADKKKVLIAEDEDFLSRALSSKISETGYEVKVAKDGEECINIIKKGEFVPDIILLDLILPKKNGFDVLADLNKNESFKKIPVVILSNLGQESDIEKTKDLGAVEFFIKSDTPINDIVDNIGKYIK